MYRTPLVSPATFIFEKSQKNQFSAGLLDFIVCCSTQHPTPIKQIIVSVGCGRAQMEMYSSDLHICLDKDKRALFCAKFATKYLFKKKSNLILQHYDMNDGLSALLSSVHIWLPWLELKVIFQHPSPSIDPRYRNALTRQISECMSLCAEDIVASVHFVYDWHRDRNCWKKNELQKIIIEECGSSMIYFTTTADRCISIDETLMVHHPIHGIVPRRGWALLKRGEERSFSVLKNINIEVKGRSRTRQQHYGHEGLGCGNGHWKNNLSA